MEYLENDGSKPNNGPKRKTFAIAVGGGPAPGINGVIGAATIEAENQGHRVLGLQDGFRWLARGDYNHVEELTTAEVSRIHFVGGSHIGTSRENPTTDPKKMENVIRGLKELGVDYLITIGGDDTAYAASRINEELKGEIKVAHVPKTIDNDLPLPGGIPTFGYETARSEGARIVRFIMMDARTTKRWYFIVAMGRKAGFLALGIGKAIAATLILIPEEFSGEHIHLQHVCDIVEGSIIKRRAMGAEFGVVIMAEGLAERFDERELDFLKDVERDNFGHIRLQEVPLGKIIKDQVRASLARRGIKPTIVEKNVGYELRCAEPIPFDNEYTRDLGYGAVQFLLSGGDAAMITLSANRLHPMYFKDILDPVTGKTQVRYVETDTEYYKIARNYMIRLEPKDFQDEAWIAQLAEAGKMTPEEFVARFGYLGGVGEPPF